MLSRTTVAVIMGKLHLLGILGILICFTVACRAAVYMVGDSSGWDISTDLDSWANGKRFVVGDVLVFQYSSSSYSVCQLNRKEFEACNTTDALLRSSSGNTSIPLTRPGDWYFACGNRLYCLGGMKLQVHVEPNSTAPPVGAPVAAPGPAGVLPRTSKSNNNPALASSSEFVKFSHPFLLLLLGFVGYSILSGFV